MLILKNISYAHPNKDVLFSDIQLNLSPQNKIALTGDNGTGKSTLLKIIAGELSPSAGQLILNADLYYIPQIVGQYNQLSVAQALRVDDKLNALNAILEGNASAQNFSLLDDDWTIEERCKEALNYWHLQGLELNQKMETLSGGQKTKIFLAGITIHQPDLILMDEPSNHLDLSSRAILYDFIRNTVIAMIVVSHDRKLLNLLEPVYELTSQGLRQYGGNYDFYLEQKQVELCALNQDIQSGEKALRKAKDKERETMERQQKLDARGKAKQEKAGIAKIMMNTLRNNAENSSSKLKHIHAEKIGGINQELQHLRARVPDMNRMKLDFDHSVLHKGKTLFRGVNINLIYQTRQLWENPVSVDIFSGERIALKGRNGSGKTSLIKIITGELEPATGEKHTAIHSFVYVDQDYSLIENDLDVYTQASRYNDRGLEEHEIKIRLHWFLFSRQDWTKSCHTLSGGERMRLMLCCLTIRGKAPDIMILDEPTNNLDIRNIEILTTAINSYQGSLIVVSHDESFLKAIHVTRELSLDNK